MMTVTKPMPKTAQTARLVWVGIWSFHTFFMGRERMAMSVRMLARPVPSQPAWLFPQWAPGIQGVKFAWNGVQLVKKKTRHPMQYIMTTPISV